MTRVKICGLTEIDHAAAACRVGADFVGLVFAPSRRQVSGEKAMEIVQALSDTASRPAVVGVFANQDVREVNRIAAECRLDWVQLSGEEGWNYCRQIERPIIKAIHITSGKTAREVLNEMKLGARVRLKYGMIYLLDSQVKNGFGGTGQTFNWQIAREVSVKFPIMVAGGLNPENVGELITQSRPWGVDVSSGVETEGVKDTARIKTFVENVRSLNGHGHFE